MRHAPLFPLFMCAAMLACKPESDLGDRTIEVQVLALDELAGSGSAEPVRNVEVFVCEKGNINSYLRSARTDSLGRCKIEYLLCEEYTVFARKQEGELILFSSVDVNARQTLVELILTPEGTSQNGIFLMVVNGQGHPVQGAEVAWALDSSLVSGNNSPPAAQVGATDVAGRFLLVNRSAGQYHMRVRKASAFLEGRITMTVQADGIARDTLSLLPGSANGCIITCTDPGGQGLQGLRVDLHTSLSSAQANDTSASAYHGSTDIQGRFALASVVPRTYYLTVQSSEQGISYTGIITIASSGVTQLNLPFTPIALTGCRIQCIDGLGNGVAGLAANLYSSRALADSNYVALLSYSGITNVLGYANIAPAVPRWYYIAIEVEPLDTLVVDSVLVVSGTIAERSVQVLP